MFLLAWEGKGFQVNLHKVPDRMLDQFLDWRNEKIEEANQQVPPR